MIERKAVVLPLAGAPRGQRDLPVSGTELRTHCHSLIVTRYFVKMFAPATSKQRTEEDIRAWFAARERLFNQYTLPSVMQQTAQSKTWLVLVEKGYAGMLPASLAQGKIPFVEIVEIDSVAANFSDFSRDISRRIDVQLATLRTSGVADPVVCVSRIDNDDAYSNDYLETVNRIALSRRRRGMDGALVTLPHGIQYHEGHALRTYLFNNNHFPSSFHFRERPNGHVHAIAFNHSNLFAQKAAVLVVNTDLPMWVEVVHGGNVSNRFRSGMTLAESAFLDRRFGCNLRALAVEQPHALQCELAEQHVTPDISLNRMRTIRDRFNAMKPNDYLPAYAEILATAKVRSMFEIGVHEGGSLRLWRELFGDQLKLYGLDIKAHCAGLAPFPANEIFIGSQVDEPLLESIVRSRGPFDLIIDDGSHRNDHMWITFNKLFAAVSPGGIYAIEDIYTSYWERYGGGLKQEHSLVERSKAKIDEMFGKFLGAKYSRHHSSRHPPPHSPLSDTIDSVAFYRCGLLVFRKTRGRPEA